MSLENVDVVLAALDAYNAGDFDAMMDRCAPQVEAFPALPDAQPVRGRDAYRRFIEESGSAWARARFEVVEASALDEQRVLLRGRWGGEGQSSGIAASASTSIINTLQNGLIVRVEFHFDQGEAPAAARPRD
jgi:ketosteroid isomerase-like protein